MARNSYCYSTRSEAVAFVRTVAQLGPLPVRPLPVGIEESGEGYVSEFKRSIVGHASTLTAAERLLRKAGYRLVSKYGLLEVDMEGFLLITVWDD